MFEPDRLSFRPANAAGKPRADVDKVHVIPRTEIAAIEQVLVESGWELRLRLRDGESYSVPPIHKHAPLPGKSSSDEWLKLFEEWLQIRLPSKFQS